MKFTPRVTMRDVASAAGFHQTTVSLALRHDRRIPEHTRTRIAAVAERLGYKPHPLVSAYASACRSARKPSANVGTVLAYLMLANKKVSDHMAGARAAAEAQGYSLEPFVIGSAGLSLERLNTILITRNIHGLIIGPLSEAHGHFDLEWERFCTVVIEYTFTRPELDRVVHDSYSGMLLALGQCRSRGLQRVGLVLTVNGTERTEGLNDAAFWKEQKAPGRNLAAIAPLHLHEWDSAAFMRWVRRHRPQVVISSSFLMGSIAASLKQEGLRVPEDISLVCLNILRPTTISGVDQDFYALGETAARMVIDKINRNDRGVPAVRQTVLIPGRWVEGRTLRKAT